MIFICPGSSIELCDEFALIVNRVITSFEKSFMLEHMVIERVDQSFILENLILFLLLPKLDLDESAPNVAEDVCYFVGILLIELGGHY